MERGLLKKINHLFAPRRFFYVRRVTAGFLSTNYIISNGKDKFFLKRYRQKEKNKIAAIHRTKVFFSRKGVPVILPIKTSEGKSFFSHAGHWYGLFPYVRGKMFASRTIPSRGVISAARMLAKIHKAGKLKKISWKSGLRKQKDFFETHARILKIVSAKPVKDSFDRRTLKVLALKREWMESVRQPRQSLLEFGHLIHGDYHLGNLFFDSRNEVEWVFDWEKSERFPRLLELIRSLDLICFDTRHSRREFAHAKKYIRTYAKSYPFSRKAFQDCIKVYMLREAQSLWVEKEHYLKKNSRVDRFLLTDYKNLRYYDEMGGRFIRTLASYI